MLFHNQLKEKEKLLNSQVFLFDYSKLVLIKRSKRLTFVLIVLIKKSILSLKKTILVSVSLRNKNKYAHCLNHQELKETSFITTPPTLANSKEELKRIETLSSEKSEEYIRAEVEDLRVIKEAFVRYLQFLTLTWK